MTSSTHAFQPSRCMSRRFNACHGDILAFLNLGPSLKSWCPPPQAKKLGPGDLLAFCRSMTHHSMSLNSAFNQDVGDTCHANHNTYPNSEGSGPDRQVSSGEKRKSVEGSMDIRCVKDAVCLPSCLVSTQCGVSHHAPLCHMAGVSGRPQTTIFFHIF
jgi:hypothetical protein